MEENNRKGPGIFYAVVGVATLVVAIIGATFAYFSATTAPNTDITGTTADVQAMKLTVSPVANPTEQKLVPQHKVGLPTAFKATTACVDANGNAVCKVYKINITNPGTAAISSKGTLELKADSGSTFTNLKWALVENVGEDDDLSTATVNSTTNGMAKAEIASPLLAASTGSETYYVVIWIEELGTDQTAQDKGTFTGTVTWGGVDGDIQVTSTFTA